MSQRLTPEANAHGLREFHTAIEDAKRLLRAIGPETVAGFGPPKSGTPTHGAKSPYVDTSRRDLARERAEADRRVGP